ncbi:MAG: hypothetical protein WCS57_06395 [Bacillota bacterium]
MIGTGLIGSGTAMKDSAAMIEAIKETRMSPDTDTDCASLFSELSLLEAVCSFARSLRQ